MAREARERNVSALVTCGPCQMGNHERHDPCPVKAPPGVLGGAVCECKGDCAPDPALIALLDGAINRAREDRRFTTARGIPLHTLDDVAAEFGVDLDDDKEGCP